MCLSYLPPPPHRATFLRVTISSTFLVLPIVLPVFFSFSSPSSFPRPVPPSSFLPVVPPRLLPRFPTFLLLPVVLAVLFCVFLLPVVLPPPNPDKILYLPPPRRRACRPFCLCVSPPRRPSHRPSLQAVCFSPVAGRPWGRCGGPPGPPAVVVGVLPRGPKRIVGRRTVRRWTVRWRARRRAPRRRR